MSTTTLNVRGMNCASCVNHVERNLRKVAGVRDVSVNLATETATVDHDAGAAPVSSLVEAVHDAGYEAEPADADEDDPGRGHHHDDGSTTPPATRLILGAVLTAPIVVLHVAWMTQPSAWVQLALATPIQIVLGWPFYRGAWKALRHGRADMDTLVALGTTVAFAYSVFITLAGGHEVYFDTAAVILVLVGLGKWLEARARTSAAAAIRGLMSLQPPEATVLRGEREVTIPVGQVKPGDTLLVRPGGRVPVDGVVTDGQSSIDQSVVTGESLPVEVGGGSTVYAGTLNHTGAFRFRATATGKATLLAQVIELVRRAQASKADVQRLADRVSAVFVPAVLLVSLASLLGWGVTTGNWPFAITTMVAVLIVACPCALGLATPTAIMVGTGLGAQRGILIKDAAAFERAGSLTDAIFDKTGTLTRGRPAVTDVALLDGAPPDGTIDAAEMLRLAAAVEVNSEHPLGKAIVRHAQDTAPGSPPGGPLPAVERFQSITAGGVRGEVGGRSVVVGRLSTLRDAGVADLDGLTAARDRLQEAAKTAVMVAIDGRPVGLIGFADELRPEAKRVVDELHALGLRTVLLTGDNRLTAEAVARRVGIDEVVAEVLPQDKQAKVEQLQQQGRVVAMVGDGVNDAPALAAADVGIVLSGGAEIAADAGHIVLMGGGVARLPEAIRLSRATMRRIRVGLFWAFIYNLVLIPMAVAGLLHPMLAAAAMAFSSVSVVLNALYLRWRWGRSDPREEV